MKKYLFLVTDNYPFGSGEEFIQNEVNYLSESFKKVFIITMNQGDKQTKDIPNNFEVYRVNKKKIGLVKLLKKDYINDFFSEKISFKNLKGRINFIYTGHLIKESILKIIKNKKIMLKDVTLYSYWFYYGAYGISKIESKEVIKVSRAHRYDLYEEKDSHPLKRNTLSKLNWVLPCSKQGEEYLKIKYPEYKQKIYYSYLGTENLNKFEFKKNNFNIVSCSYIRPIKRIELLIESLSKLNLQNKKITWTHIGDGDSFEEIKILAQKNLKNIEFKFLGYFKNNEIIEYYKNNEIKCFINLSLSEGLPVSMMEIQSFGIPIIATNVGGVNEIVNEKTGILLPENPTPKEVSQQIEKIIFLSKEEFQNIQKLCYRNWNEKFNAKINYKKFIEKYLKENVDE